MLKIGLGDLLFFEDRNSVSYPTSNFRLAPEDSFGRGQRPSRKTELVHAHLKKKSLMRGIKMTKPAQRDGVGIMNVAERKAVDAGNLKL